MTKTNLQGQVGVKQYMLGVLWLVKTRRYAKTTSEDQELRDELQFICHKVRYHISII